MFEGHRELAERFGGETAAALGKVAPPVAVSGLTVAGVSLQDWVLILTALYTLVQLALSAPKLIQLLKGWFGRG